MGAGSGYYTVRLAKQVGPNGRVYATDVQLATETFESQAKDVSAKVRKTVK